MPSFVKTAISACEASEQLALHYIFLFRTVIYKLPIRPEGATRLLIKSILNLTTARLNTPARYWGAYVPPGAYYYAGPEGNTCEEALKKQKILFHPRAPCLSALSISLSNLVFEEIVYITHYRRGQELSLFCNFFAILSGYFQP